MQNQGTQYARPFPYLLGRQLQGTLDFIAVIALLSFRQLVEFPYDTGFHLFGRLVREGDGQHVLVLRRGVKNDLEVFHGQGESLPRTRGSPVYTQHRINLEFKM